MARGRANHAKDDVSVLGEELMGDSANMVLVGFAIGSILGLVSVACFLLGRLSRDGVISFPPRKASGQPATAAQDAASGTLASTTAKNSEDGAAAGTATDDAAADVAANDATQASDAHAATVASGSALGSSPDATDADIPTAPLYDEPRDIEELSRRLAEADNPLRELHTLTRDTLAQERAADDDPTTPHPDAFSLYLARGLQEAGIDDPDAHIPDFEVVLPYRTKTFFLRTTKRRIPEREALRVVALEGALNRALFAWKGLGHTATLEECYAFNQGLASTITAQLGTKPIKQASMLDVAGEWGVRQTFSAGIESLRLPLRLSVRFRVNLMGGDIAIETPYRDALCQPRSVYSEGLERIIPATSQMRDQMATDYALRLTLLLAAHAFHSSRRLCHAFVAVVDKSPRGRRCLVSADISREALREHDLSKPFDARELCRELGVDFHIEEDRLCAVEQGFVPEAERFCPASRYDNVDLSSRILPDFEAGLLGTKYVHDLGINEDAHRSQVAEAVARQLGGTTLGDVRRIIDLTQNDRDATVREAGERCVQAIIDGRLDDKDSLAFVDEFVNGGALSRATAIALDQISSGKSADAIETLTDVLAPVDALDTYADGNGVVWREFTSYVSRALYNRLLAKEGEKVRLVPDAYFAAQLLMASALIDSGRQEEALGFARRAQDLCPFDVSGTLRAARCFELDHDFEAAANELIQQLEYAFDPQSVGVCYYRLAFLEWKLGEAGVADACYQKAVMSHSACSMAAHIELMSLRVESGSDGVAAEDVEETLRRANIPLAPTERVVEVLVEAAQGATDAEVFPVARGFATLLSALSGDDVMHGVANSMENEPDR